MERADLVIVGGGLAGGLAALALRQRRPELYLLLLEAGERIGGNHLWSFFESDIAPGERALVEPLIVHRWPGYDVRFPEYARHLDQPYRTITSEALDCAVRAALPPERIVKTEAVALTPTSVTLADGRVVVASQVLDARGGIAEGLILGWQKFLGQLLVIPQGHGLSRPIVMDATVTQQDGYRFVYCLPFSPTELFVEDTYYSDTPNLDEATLRERIADYAAAAGWQISHRSREETGVLPVVMDGDFDRLWPREDMVARAGSRAGLFHPLTSYSLPDAVRFAAWLARQPLDGLGMRARARAVAHWRRGAYYRLLTAMLFRAAEPGERYRILERFYRLSGPLIARFYAGQSSLIDKFRILSGRPPVPVRAALRVLKDRL